MGLREKIGHIEELLEQSENNNKEEEDDTPKSTKRLWTWIRIMIRLFENLVLRKKKRRN